MIHIDHPVANRYNWKETHLEQLRVYRKLLFLYCSKYDTFLKYYTILYSQSQNFQYFFTKNISPLNIPPWHSAIGGNHQHTSILFCEMNLTKQHYIFNSKRSSVLKPSTAVLSISISYILNLILHKETSHQPDKLEPYQTSPHALLLLAPS